MRAVTCLVCLVGLILAVPAADGDFTVDYTVDRGGHSSGPLNGLAARAVFGISGDQLSITLENTSTGVPDGFEVSDSLLTSVGMNLLDGVRILSGDAARIGPGSIGLGSWSERIAGDSVGEQWIWTNDFGGDALEDFAQVISTSSGQGAGTVTRFDGGVGSVNGPFGGIAADPPILSIPHSKPAVSDSIVFALTLTGGLTETQLAQIANSSIVEFGSDQRYLGVPEPATFALMLAGYLLHRFRRQ